MPDINTQLRDISIAHQHMVERYSNLEVQRMMNILDGLEEEIRNVLRRKAIISNWTKKRQQVLLAQVSELQKVYHAKLDKMFENDLSDFGVVEAEVALNNLATVLNPVGLDISLNIITPEKLLAAAKRNKIMLHDGATFSLTQMLRTFKVNDIARAEQLLQQGFLLGETGAQMEQKLFRQGGKYNLTRNNARTIVRTGISHMGNTARDMVYSENSDIVKGYQWVSTMDNRTTDICIHRDSMTWFYDAPESSTLEGPVKPPAHYRCYDTETEVYTDKGWRYFYDLNGTEKCLSFNIDDRKENGFVSVKKYVEYPYDGDMIHFYSKTFDMMVTPNHQMVALYTKKDGSGKDRFVQADKFPKWNNSVYRGLEYNVREYPETIDIGGHTLSSSGFALLMGYYLSEGSTTKTSKNSYRIKIAQEKYLDEFYDALMEYDWPFKIHKNTESIDIYNQGLGDYLKQFGHSHEKYIPQVIKNMDVDRINIFVDAYVLGDGSMYKGSKWKGGNFSDYRVIHTSSKQMADDLGELILKIGMCPSYYFKPTMGTWQTFKNGTYQINHDLWTVYLKSRTSSSVDRINRTSVPYNDMVYCVELEKWHTLLVRRNGKVAWSGNCRSVTTPITRSWKELGINLAEAPPGMRASMTGQVPADQNYKQWLATAPTSIQRDVLGRTRYDMWKDDIIDIDSFWTKDGRRLTLSQLRKKGYEISNIYAK